MLPGMKLRSYAKTLHLERICWRCSLKILSLSASRALAQSQSSAIKNIIQSQEQAQFGAQNQSSSVPAPKNDFIKSPINQDAPLIRKISSIGQPIAEVTRPQDSTQNVSTQNQSSSETSPKQELSRKDVDKVAKPPLERQSKTLSIRRLKTGDWFRKHSIETSIHRVRTGPISRRQLIEGSFSEKPPTQPPTQPPKIIDDQEPLQSSTFRKVLSIPPLLRTVLSKRTYEEVIPKEEPRRLKFRGFYNGYCLYSIFPYPEKLWPSDKIDEKGDGQKQDVLHLLGAIPSSAAEVPLSLHSTNTPYGPRRTSQLRGKSSLDLRSSQVVTHVNQAWTQSRSFGTSYPKFPQAGAESPISDQGRAIDVPYSLPESLIRDHLLEWQKQQDDLNKDKSQLAANATKPSMTVHGSSNLFNRHDKLQDTDAADDNEDSKTETDLESDEESTVGMSFLRKGDMVELMANGELIVAIFVRNLRWQSQFYTMQGKWVHRYGTGVIFSAPQLVLPVDVDPILPYLPAEDIPADKLDTLFTVDLSVPREAGTTVIEKMLSFYRSTNDIIRLHASRLNHAFEIVAHPTKHKYATLNEIAMKVLRVDREADLSSDMLWAVHRSIRQNGFFRINQVRHHRMIPLFDILSKKDADDMGKVTDWMRAHQEQVVTQVTGASIVDPDPDNEMQDSKALSEFANRARSIIRESRKARALTTSGTIGPKVSKPSYSKFKDTAAWPSDPSPSVFTDEDRSIIKYLRLWTTSSTVQRKSSLATVGPSILRAVGMYEGVDLGKSTGFTLLQELGFITPWVDRVVLDQAFPIPRQGAGNDVDRLFEQARESATNCIKQDSMQALRHDWGDMPVFCIDADDAQEIDDGVSLGETDDTDLTTWVHVHIANPSAFIDHNSAVGLFAAEFVQTVYLVGKAYPMLPPRLSSMNFSLAPDRPCITFSAKITSSGDIAETKITPGMVRNVIKITPDMADRQLRPERGSKPLQMNTIVVGARATTPTIDSKSRDAPLLQHLTASQVKTLERLRDIGTTRRRRREGILSVLNEHNQPDPQIQVWFDEKCPRDDFFRNSGGKFSSGDPTIMLQATIAGPALEASPSRDLVRDLMVLAGEVGAQWCGERNIPISYRGTLRNPEPGLSPEQFKSETIDPIVAKTGRAPPYLLRRYRSLIGKSADSTSPIEHVDLGLAAYSRVTSPLRRYADLLAHWQIEAALRHEAQTGTSLIDRPDNEQPYLPFPRAQVQSLVTRITWRQSLIRDASRSSRKHWTAQLFFRAFYFHEAPLPDTFEVAILHDISVGANPFEHGIITAYGVPCQIVADPQTERAGGFVMGDLWEAKIARVDCYARVIHMQAVRLIRRDDLPRL